ncbi:MAG TPA: NAD(P)-dependent oxidoreductase [Anaeromyxobacteraceae bacterium]|nr:NAD(P)-dependent oxidoreductase [Anaeromyxobacteraceae bacterium]
MGLGTMGAPLANNLRKAGHEITVWNRTAAKADALVRKGTALAKTPRECAFGRDLVFTCLSDEQALEAVLAGPQGALEALETGDVLVDTSTCGTREARSLDARARERGAFFVAAPILGSRAAAEKAQIIIIAGGPGAARERARPALRAISARVIEYEDAVQAALMKLVVNTVGSAMMAGFSEALALGASGGLDPTAMVETIQASPFHSPLYLMKGEQILAKDFAPRFSISLAEKDSRLAQEAAADQGARMPVSAAVKQLFSEAIESGRGSKDMTAIAELFFR